MTSLSFLIQQTATPALSTTFQLSNQKFHQLDQHRHMGRNDGNKQFFKTRAPTQKKKKQYHKRMREMHHQQVGRHSKPGFKAGPRREYFEDEFQFKLDRARGKIPAAPTADDLEYDFGDALVDDLMGNSAHLSASPTPKPVYLGRQYAKHYSKVSGLMQEYHAHLQLAKSTTQGTNANANANANANETETALALAPPLPTDKEISYLLKSYRDRNSNKYRPLGIVKALRHLVTDIRLPTSIFEEKTYAALMSCAASPKEARRIMKMMEENGQPVDAYIYSILVDIHSKRGDFRGADEVLSEMRLEGIEPTLAAYTSLLAACYKVINTGSMPQQIKAEAGTLAWDRWKEAKINDLEPDVMAYGAIIRIMAARGLPERALNIIEEMQIKGVQPTTLIFSGALNAVARSHANALRFEGGRSKKNKRREKIAAHHGKMARNIVILAERASVEQDDGFVSALMMCAGTAGDSATVKAIYLASEVRKLEDMRKIGGSEHLQMLRGKNPVDNNSNVETSYTSKSNSDQGTSLVPQEGSPSLPSQLSYNPQKRRRDTRKLNALVSANARAVENRGLGNLWGGRENKGYLCENSLRMIQQRYVPQYVDKSIPGISGTDSGLASMVWDDEDVEKMGKRLRRKKFMGLLEDTDDNRMDELDPTLYRLFAEDEDALFDEEQKDGQEEESAQQRFESFKFEGRKLFKGGVQGGSSTRNSEAISAETTEPLTNVSDEKDDDNDDEDEDDINGIELQNMMDAENELRKTMEATDIDEATLQRMMDSDDIDEANLQSMLGVNGISEIDFEKMLDDENSEEGMSDKERDLFDKIMSEEGMSAEEKDLFGKMMSEFENESDDDDDDDDDEEEMSEEEEALFEKMMSEFDSESDDDDDDDFEVTTEEVFQLESPEDALGNKLAPFAKGNGSTFEVVETSDSRVALPEDADDLDVVLYGLPQSRIDTVRDEFERNLGSPSMIRLVPMLRENMPEEVHKEWLVSKNLRDANVVMQMAEDDGIVDVQMMNSMLQVFAYSNKVEEALEYYENEFEAKNKVRLPCFQNITSAPLRCVPFSHFFSSAATKFIQ